MPDRRTERRTTGEMQKRVFLLAIASFLFFLPAAGEGIVSSGVRTAGEIVEPFSCEGLSGETITFESLLDGKDFLVIVFWGVNCGPCVQEFERLSAMWANPRFRQRAAMIAVNTDGRGAETLKDQMEERRIRIPFPVIPDEDQMITNAYVDGLIPLTVLIDRERRVRFSILGGGEEGTLLLERSILGDGGMANR